MSRFREELPAKEIATSASPIIQMKVAHVVERLDVIVAFVMLDNVDNDKDWEEIEGKTIGYLFKTLCAEDTGCVRNVKKSLRRQLKLIQFQVEERSGLIDRRELGKNEIFRMIERASPIDVYLECRGEQAVRELFVETTGEEFFGGTHERTAGKFYTDTMSAIPNLVWP